MTYSQLIRYVFEQEGQDFDSEKFRLRKRELVQARQISMMLAFEILHLKDHQCAEPFEKDRTSFYAAQRHVTDLLESDKKFAVKYASYKQNILNVIATENAIRPVWISDFLNANARESLTTTNGLYYPHDEVCYLLTLILKHNSQ